MNATQSQLIQNACFVNKSVRGIRKAATQQGSSFVTSISGHGGEWQVHVMSETLDALAAGGLFDPVCIPFNPHYPWEAYAYLDGVKWFALYEEKPNYPLAEEEQR